MWLSRARLSRRRLGRNSGSRLRRGWLNRNRLSRLRWLRRRHRSRRGRRPLRCRSHGILRSGYWLSRLLGLSRVLRLGWSLGCRYRGRLGGLRGLLRRGDRSRINRLSRLIRLVFLSLRLIHTHVVDVHSRARRPIYTSALVIIGKLGRVDVGLIRPVARAAVLWTSKVVTAHHLVQLQDVVVIRVDERVRTLDIAHLHTVCHLAIEVELNRVGSLEHTVGVELALRRGCVTVHHALMLLVLLRVVSPRCVRVAHQVLRVVTLGLEDVSFAVPWPRTQLLVTTGEPERGPR